MSSSVFNVFHKVLLEKNYSYLIPQDKELLLYDFYMLVHLNALNKEGRFEPGDKKDPYGQVSTTATRSMGLSDSTKFSFEEIKHQVMDYLQPELLEAALFSISCEIRHAFDMNTVSDIPNKIQDPQDFFRNFRYNYAKLKSMKSFKSSTGGIDDIINKRRRAFNKKYDIKIKKNTANRNTDYQMSYKAVKRTLKSINMSEIDFVRLAGNAFLKLSWAGSYGGKPWASICDAFQKLYYAKREVDKIIYIDNMYHQQHNTDTVFNKLGQYYKNGYHWVLNALNFKADVKDNWDRIERIRKVTGNKMRNIDKMYIEMLKASGDKTWQQYYKIENKTDEQKKIEDEWLDDLGSSNGGSSAIPSKLQQKYYNLAKDGIVKFRNHFEDGYVYMGKGDDKDKSIEQDLITTIPDLITKYGYQGLYIEGVNGKMSDDPTYSGSDVDGNYFLDKKTWEKIFGPVPSEDKIAPINNRLAKFKKEFIDYAKHGIENMSNILGDKYVYMGKGSADKSIKDKIIEHFPNIPIKTIHDGLRRLLNNGTVIGNAGYSGSIASADYLMDKKLWERIFGPLSDIITKKDKELLAKLEEDDSSGKTLEDFKKQGPSIFPKTQSIVTGNYIYTGQGKDIKKLLKPVDDKFVKEPEFYYMKSEEYTAHKSWSTIPMPYKDLKDDDYTCIYDTGWTKLADILKDHNNEANKTPSSIEGEKATSFDEIKEKGKILFPKTYGISDEAFVYVGLGRDAKKYITTLRNKTTKTHLIFQSEFSGNQSDWLPVKTIDSIEDDHHICVEYSYWKSNFKDKESNKNKTLPPETIEHYKKLAKEGKKKFNDPHVANMNIVYIGHGTGVETAIKHGILPYNNSNDKEAYGKWLTSGKWERLTSLSDISLAYDVWMMNYQWVALFGPIADLISKSDKKRVPASARAKFRKIAKEYLEAGKFYHNYKKQRLIPLGDGSTINADADITALLTPENIYGNHKTDDDNEIYLMNGLEGNHKDLNYFTTEDKWEELFGPLPMVYNNSEKSDTNKAVAKVDAATKDEMINWAKESYNYKTFQHIIKDYVYLGNNYDGSYTKKDSVASKLSKMGYTIYTYKYHHQEYVEPEDVIPLSGVIDENPNDFFLIKDDWIKITGELPPPNLTF
jgi:hypothetical protein